MSDWGKSPETVWFIYHFVSMACSSVGLRVIRQPNTDHFQWSWRLCQRLHVTIEKVKIVPSFDNLGLDWWDSRLECLNRVTDNYGKWKSVPIRDCKRKTIRLCCVLHDCVITFPVESFLSFGHSSFLEYLHK